MTTFVGFGFGAIQAGLFLYEAARTGAFDRLVVAEVIPARVAALRAAGGVFQLNIAHADGVEQTAVGPVEIYDPARARDRSALIDAIAEAHELATAIPSVNFYVGEGAGSLHRILAAGIARKLEQGGPQAALYAAENHNHAAEMLAEAVNDSLPVALRAEGGKYVAFLNTVIGKMSGVAPAGRALAAGMAPLAPITPESREAFLVEAFNRILVSTPHLPVLPGQVPYARLIRVFAEKPDLLPFEEAKLYGHNALHAVAAYLGWYLGLDDMSQLRDHPAALALARRGAVEEAGVALCRRYAGIDPIFTPTGFGDYVDDLLKRMVNPNLRDAIARVVRDPARKLGWHDRLVGAMRLALAADIEPCALATGAAAAYACLLAERPDQANLSVHRVLDDLWQADAPPRNEAELVGEWIVRGRHALSTWRP
jgi:mannitol-1-phosphate 5-dehydrogenase